MVRRTAAEGQLAFHFFPSHFLSKLLAFLLVLRCVFQHGFQKFTQAADFAACDLDRIYQKLCEIQTSDIVLRVRQPEIQPAHARAMLVFMLFAPARVAVISLQKNAKYCG